MSRQQPFAWRIILSVIGLFSSWWFYPGENPGEPPASRSRYLFYTAFLTVGEREQTERWLLRFGHLQRLDAAPIAHHLARARCPAWLDLGVVWGCLLRPILALLARRTWLSTGLYLIAGWLVTSAALCERARRWPRLSDGWPFLLGRRWSSSSSARLPVGARA